ncbi:MAG: MBL fold metallo-hydrolase [Desulfosoma sp.]|uniref:MBL fold metallo-hydrolase n=1 Tax=Desulfosoma sp. TaxID=2603217 RepID=UPI004049B3DB
MILEQLVVGMLQTNCYLLGDEPTRQAVVIDPGGDAARIIKRLQQLDVTLAAILNTHGHFDSVKDKIFPMDDATRVLPGHGPETTVGREKRTNPFF